MILVIVKSWAEEGLSGIKLYFWGRIESICLWSTLGSYSLFCYITPLCISSGSSVANVLIFYFLLLLVWKAINLDVFQDSLVTHFSKSEGMLFLNYLFDLMPLCSILVVLCVVCGYCLLVLYSSFVVNLENPRVILFL